MLTKQRLLELLCLVAVCSVFAYRTTPPKPLKLYGKPTINGLSPGQQFQPNKDFVNLDASPVPGEKAWWSSQSQTMVLAIHSDIVAVWGPTVRLGDYTFGHTFPLQELFQLLSPHYQTEQVGLELSAKVQQEKAGQWLFLKAHYLAESSVPKYENYRGTLYHLEILADDIPQPRPAEAKGRSD